MANILIPLPSIDWNIDIKIVGKSTNQNSSLTIITKYLIQTPRIKENAATLKVMLKPNLFRQIAAGKFKTIHDKKKVVAHVLTTMSFV